MPETWKKCGHPRTVENTCQVSARLPGGRCRTCQLAAQRQYDASEKGRARDARYDASEKGRATDARYYASEKGILTCIEHNANKRRG